MSKEQFLPFFMDMPLYLVKEKEAEVATAEAADEQQPADNHVHEDQIPYEAKAIPTDGQNLKSCVILLANEKEFTSERAFLLKVLKSVKRSMDDVLLANCTSVSQDQLEALLSEHNHRHLISFGVELPASRATKDKYSVHSIKQVKVLLSDTLGIIQEDTEKKKALWKALQSMFLV